MLKNLLKFLSWGFAIILLGTTILYGMQYLTYKNSPEYQATQNLEKLKKQYAEDPYGGDTPEETLRLFIDALKKGDTNLAAKYFVLDKQEEWKEDLAKIKEKNLLKDMIRDLGETRLKINGGVAYFTLNRQNDYPSELVMHKNIANNKWKITEL